MWVSFEQLPAQARVWVYQADRTLSGAETGQINRYLEQQIEGWNTHGSALQASARVMYDRFVVIAANEQYQAPSGCSIDASVRWLRDLGTTLGIDFFDRSVAYRQGEEIFTTPLPGLKQLVEKGAITPQTIVFNNAILTREQLEKNWQVEAGNSWMKRYFALSKVIE